MLTSQYTRARAQVQDQRIARASWVQRGLRPLRQSRTRAAPASLPHPFDALRCKIPFDALTIAPPSLVW
eukprot:6174346-Pleurochrysis_carterae.AAC.1